MKNNLFKVLTLLALASMFLAACGGNIAATQAPAEKVKVVIFVGMRFRIATRSARISCLAARSSPITKMFSFSRIARAGRVDWIFMGMIVPKCKMRNDKW